VHYVGDLAESWSIEGGGTRARFALATDRLWEDTTRVGAEDVVESYRLYRDPRISQHWPARLREITSVRGDDAGPNIVVFRFRSGLSRERILQFATLPLICAHQWQRHWERKPPLGIPKRLPLAAGSFRFLEWTATSSIVLARHPFPPDGRRPASDKLEIRIVPPERGRMLQFTLGACDLAVDLPLEEVVHRRDGPRRDDLIRAEIDRIETVVWNLNDPLMSRQDLRRFVADALDHDQLRWTLARRDRFVLGAACDQFRGMFGGLPKGRETAPVRKAVLGSPLQADSVKRSLVILYDEAASWREQAAVEISLQLEPHGIDCHLAPVPAEELVARIQRRDFQAALIGWNPPMASDLGEIYRSDGIFNLAGLEDPLLDELVDAARSSAADTIPSAWQQVESCAAGSHPFLFLQGSVRIDGTGPRLTDYRPGNGQPYGNLLQVRLRVESDR
jgi:ABC-type transport system substrate-binding protein